MSPELRQTLTRITNCEKITKEKKRCYKCMWQNDLYWGIQDSFAEKVELSLENRLAKQRKKARVEVFQAV